MAATSKVVRAGFIRCEQRRRANQANARKAHLKQKLQL